MKVKKINPEWFPSENKSLAVGDTIEITDPEALIRNGDVVGITEEGTEVGSWELYGVVNDNDINELKEFKRLKQEEALQKKLQEEKESLEKEKAELEAQAETAKEEVAVVEEKVVEEVKTETPVVEKTGKKK